MDAFEKHLRKGTRTKDGRTVFMGIEHNGETYICCDPSILERAEKNLSIPDPGETAEDGYVTPWEKAAGKV